MKEQEIIEAIENGEKVEYKVGVIDGETNKITDYIWLEHKDLNISYSSLAEKLTKHEFRIKTFEWRFKSVETMIKNGLKIYSGDDEGFFIKVEQGYSPRIRWDELSSEINPGLAINLPGFLELIGEKVYL